MAKEKKILVAITGNIGSGKSTFSKFISDFGYPVLYADDISKEILAHDSEVRTEIIKTFGAQSFLGKNINNKFLADQVFSNPKKLKKINSILHPRVRSKIEILSKEYFNSNTIVFVEAALIFESKIEKMYDFTVLITADNDLRMRRSTKSKKISESEFRKRDSNQLDQDTKKKKADFVFSNNGSKDELKQKAVLLIKLLEATL